MSEKTALLEEMEGLGIVAVGSSYGFASLESAIEAIDSIREFNELYSSNSLEKISKTVKQRAKNSIAGVNVKEAVNYSDKT